MAASDKEQTGSVADVLSQVLDIMLFIIPLARTLIDSNKNAAEEIKRVLSADPGLAAMRAEWDERLDSKFGQDG